MQWWNSLKRVRVTEIMTRLKLMRKIIIIYLSWRSVNIKNFHVLGVIWKYRYLPTSDVVGSLESDVAHAPLKFAPSFPTEHMGQSPVGSRLSTVDIGLSYTARVLKHNRKRVFDAPNVWSLFNVQLSANSVYIV